ncbi:hypothetical protein BH23VER1_BH23VER1_07160 [soil metagenome]
MKLKIPTMLHAGTALIMVSGPVQAFDFQKGDTVALIGNGLADRMQHDGWTETLLQSALADKELVIRNLGFTGDTVTNRPRNEGFTSPEDYLKLVGADVIIVMFGYNESFAGENGVDGFKNDLGAMIDRYRELKPNGESAPRFILFSPIAHEDLNDPNLPDGSANNARLALYSEAVKAVADQKGETFVDLFTPSKALYDGSDEALTLNGVHLSQAGNRALAEVIASAVTGTEVAASDRLEPLREAVLDKNWNWFNRYRATDGNDVWGGRASLAFVDGQTNRDVLEHELTMLDVLTANRDPRIWARAKGSDGTVDDSNVPPPVPVVSNVGGGSPSSSADKEGSSQYLSGEEGLNKITVPDGFEVNLFADEARFPELANPVQMQVDASGRLWVAAWKTYPKWEPLTEMEDRLLIFPDDDGDGVADRAITFAKVHNPLGFEFWNGGVIVSSQPELIFLKDTDGDDVADVREVLLQGIGSADTHHAANNLIYGPDGAIYWQSGIFLHNTIEHPWGPSLSTGASAMYRFDPRRYTISVHAGNSPNPHGTSFDYWGYHFASDGTGGNAFQVRPEGDGFKMHELLKKEVRPVAANEVVSSQNFPESMQQDFLICNTIGFLGIKQYGLERNPENGHVWGEPKGDLLVSSDKNFRPTDAIFGADGALYVSDWHNVIIGHMQHNVRDPNRDHRHGRIYRMRHADTPLQEPVKIAGAPVADLLKNLEHPVDGVRHRTRVELSGRQTSEVMAVMPRWLATLDSTKPEHAHHFLEALWVHQQHNVKDAGLLKMVLDSPEPHARIAAKTVEHHWFRVDPTKGSPAAEAEEAVVAQESGVLSDTPELTEVRVGTLVEQLKFDIASFRVKAGKKVKLTLANSDYLPHNLVIVTPGASDEVGMAAMQLGAEGFKLDWRPESDKILAATKLIDHRQQDTIEFAAPSEPGNYEFVCTFPGHHILMRGVMEVF